MSAIAIPSGRCRVAERPEVKVIFAGMAGVLLWASTRWRDLREIVEDAYNAFEAASRKCAPPAVIFTDPRALMMAMYGVATTMCGEIDSSLVRQRLDRDLLLVEHGQRKTVLGLLLLFETVWEYAAGSDRIKNLLQAVGRESEASNGETDEVWIPFATDYLPAQCGTDGTLLDLLQRLLRAGIRMANELTGGALFFSLIHLQSPLLGRLRACSTW